MSHRAIAARSALVTLVPLLLVLTSASCADERERRGVGSVCAAPAQCASGLCSAQVCIDPFSCVSALAANQDATFIAACIGSLGDLAIDPNPGEVEPGGSIQLTLSGALTSTTTGTDAPMPDGGAIGEADGASDFATDSAALTAAIDLTAAARFSSSDPELVTFSEETPGLATVRVGVGSMVTVFASVGSGAQTRSAQGTLFIGASTNTQPSGEQGGADTPD